MNLERHGKEQLVTFQKETFVKKNKKQKNWADVIQNFPSDSKCICMHIIQK